MARKRAPAKLTGGAGFRYEDHVAARFLLDILGGTNTIGHEFGSLCRIDWQARDAGWLADDLALYFSDGGVEKGAGLSIKSDRQVTSAGFPSTFVEIAWGQWLGEGTNRKLREGLDCVGLVTGRLANKIGGAWSKTLSEALQTTPERMLARLTAPASKNDGSQSSALQRTLFQSIACPEALVHRGDSGDLPAVRLLRHIRLLHFDFDDTPSRDRDRAIADCQAVLRSGDRTQATDLWDRLIGISAEKRAAGGSADLAELLRQLRAIFDLLDHPDYRADWDALRRFSRDMVADVRTEIVGLPRLSRDEDRNGIERRLRDNGHCFLVGDSGSGKSALVKTLAEGYEGIVWLTDDAFSGASLGDLERRMGLTHALAGVLRASPKPCLVVFDGLESFSENALRLTVGLIKDVQSVAYPGQVHVLLVAQTEASRQVVMRLVENAVPLSALDIMVISRPHEDEIRDLVLSLPQIRWTALRPELRPLLTNLKILDWVVAAVRAGAVIDDQAVFGLTSLVDRLWNRWVEGNDRGYARSHFLMRLSTLETKGLTAGVPRTQFDHAEQSVLQELTASDLIYLRDERVRFTHDLLGDWARMRVLLAEQPTASPADRDRASTPRWHRAVRLYGQRLLEQSTDGANRWRRTIEQAEDGTEAGLVVRDLMLEAVFLSTYAGQLLEHVWPILIASEGRLLHRLLDRFLFVATLPYPNLTAFTGSASDAAKLEYAFRLPFVPYWAPALAVLYAHRDEVARLAPLMGARVCTLWLKSMPLEWESGRPLRRLAAELALTIAREIQGRKAEGEYFSQEEDKLAYEAALYAAVDLPDPVGQLCLELAKRRDPPPEIQFRAEKARREQQEANESWRQEDPVRAEQSSRLTRPLFPVGPRRDPWPDGPRERVEEAFKEVCLETLAFASLARARPDVALEVLLAICIERPRREDPFGSTINEDCGVVYWPKGYPPLYFRGPFLPFLRQAPDQALTFILRLVNFATKRCMETEPRRLQRMGMGSSEADVGFTIPVDGIPRHWYGDARTFRWHHDWPLAAKVIPSALMALEKWLYQKLDDKEDIKPWLKRILRESESLAFAGVLLDVGKRAPELFTGILQPLLHEWRLYDFDVQVTVERCGASAGMLGWQRQSAREIDLARQWYEMPHRKLIFRDIMVYIVIGQKRLCPLFEKICAAWRIRFDKDGQPNSLRLLIERFNPANYTEHAEEGTTRFEFTWPDEIQRKHETEQKADDEQLRLMMFPFQCRDILDKQKSLPAEQLVPFWETLQAIAVGLQSMSDDFGHVMVRAQDSVCGGIAVLLTHHLDWLKADGLRMTWCREKLFEVMAQPPQFSPMDSENSTGNRQWDAFAAECGIILLAEDNGDELARMLVAVGVVGYRYATTALTMARGFQRREKLGEDFDRMLSLAIQGTGVRALYNRAKQLQSEPEKWLKRHSELIQEFIDGKTAPKRQALCDIHAKTAAELEKLRAHRYRDWKKSETNPADEEQGHEGSNRALHLLLPAIDLQMLASACTWLDLGAARTGEERRKWLALLHELLDLVLSLFPTFKEDGHERLDDLPSDFDHWLFSVIARNLLTMASDEDPETLWIPILDLKTPAHQWIEGFFWEWFTHGVQAAAQPERFTAIWERMIAHCLKSDTWDPARGRTLDLANMASEILGFHFGLDTVGKDDRFTSALAGMQESWEKAAARWFSMARVLNGFTRFVVRPACMALLLPGVQWLWVAVKAFDEDDWQERNLEVNLVGVLHEAWEHHQEKIIADSSIRESFLGMLTRLASRGHAATALRDRVLESIGRQ